MGLWRCPMDASAAKVIKGRAPLKASQELRAAIRSRGKAAGSIGFFYSAKNDREIVVPSDLQLAHVLHLEADESVRSFDIDVPRVYGFIQDQGYKGSKPDASVVFHSGRTCLVEVKYAADVSETRAVIQAEVQRQAALAIGADWAWYTDEDATRSARLINDWLHIAPVLSQTRWDVAAVWHPLTAEILGQIGKESITLGELEECHRPSWALTFSAAWRLVQKGVLASDLAKNPLSPDTTLQVMDRHGLQ